MKLWACDDIFTVFFLPIAGWIVHWTMVKAKAKFSKTLKLNISKNFRIFTQEKMLTVPVKTFAAYISQQRRGRKHNYRKRAVNNVITILVADIITISLANTHCNYRKRAVDNIITILMDIITNYYYNFFVKSTENRKFSSGCACPSLIKLQS